MNPKNNQNKEEAYDKFNLANACSAGDCTGLIPAPPMNEEEAESYMDIYDYRAPDLSHQESKENKEPKTRGD